MLYKFIGGKDERALLCAFDNIFGRGSMKFSNAHTFIDPFEFKYGSVFPQTRAQVEAWHKAYSRFNVSDGDINELWRNLESGGRDYIFGVEHRVSLLKKLYVLCLTEESGNHLLWAHYTSSHAGFCVMLHSEIVEAYSKLVGSIAIGPVNYRSDVPTWRWFAEPFEESIRSVVLSKSPDWSYEREYRIAMVFDNEHNEKFIEVNASLMAGIILGARSPNSLRDRALALRESRPEFLVKQVASNAGVYGIRFKDVSEGRFGVRHIL